jgi:arabinan endo-1,5-alpha-L-arabinosidase
VANWLAAGRYTITSQGSGKAWAAATCTTSPGQGLVQSMATGQPCQQWQLSPQENGFYKITNVLSGLNADVTDCAETAGTKLGLQASSPLNCQQFKLERAADGSYVLAALYGNRVIEVPNAATTDGQQLGLWDYNNCTCQHWLINPASTITATAPASQQLEIQLFPNPTSSGSFTVQLPVAIAATIKVADLSGRVVYYRAVSAATTHTNNANLQAGTYLVQVTTPTVTVTKKLIVL